LRGSPWPRGIWPNQFFDMGAVAVQLLLKVSTSPPLWHLVCHPLASNYTDNANNTNNAKFTLTFVIALSFSKLLTDISLTG
jgi:hypothetical protein